MARAADDHYDVWTARITAVGAILSPALTLLILWYQTRQTTREIKEDITYARKKVREDISEAKKATDVAAEHAEVAAKETKEIRGIAEENTELNKAQLQQWKAFHTKDPEDMNRAAEAISKVESKNETRSASIGPQPPN